MTQEVNIQIAIMSHISDAQYLMRAYKMDEADMHMNFAKMLLIKYRNTDVYETEDKLNELWCSLENRINKNEEK